MDIASVLVFFFSGYGPGVKIKGHTAERKTVLNEPNPLTLVFLFGLSRL